MKTLKNILMLTTGLFLFLGRAYAGDYVSLYHYAQENSYCSDSTNLGGQWEEGAYPCANSEYPYKYSRSLAGFRDIYDLDDPKILCGKDYPNTADCNKEEGSASFQLTTIESFVDDKDLTAFPDGFRFFIPPGTVYAGVTVFMPRDAKIGLLLRYKHAPEGIYLPYAGDPQHYGDVPWDRSSEVSLDLLESRDVYVHNGSGHAEALPGGGISSPLGPEDSGWFYIRKMPFGSNKIQIVKVTLIVDLGTYLQWYNSVRPFGTSGCVDSNHASQGSTYCWDEGGDPWAEGAYVQSITSCSPSNLDGCIDTGGCEGAGGFWYGSTCNTEPICTDQTLGNCTTEDTCEGSGLYWYDGICNGNPQCDDQDVSQCTSQNTCEDAGFFWYNTKCNATPPCSASHLDVCTNKTDCEAVGGTWDGSQCIDTSCGSDNLEGCHGSVECQVAGGVWAYPDSCTESTESAGGGAGGSYSPPPSSSSSNPFSGFFGMFNPAQTTSAATCGPTQLDLCQTKTECESAGGYLADGKCRPKELAPVVQEEPEDLSSQTESAPLCLVDGAASDGVVIVNSGEKLFVKVNLPGYGSPVDVYVAVQIPGSGGGRLFYIQNDESELLVEQLHAFRTGFMDPMNLTLVEKFDACTAFGGAYDGDWYVYLLVVPTLNDLDAPQTTDELLNLIEDNDIGYRLQWYHFKVQCGGQ